MSEPVQMNIKLDPALKAELERRSKEEHRSMNGHIAYLIERDARPTPIPTTPQPAQEAQQ